MKWFPLLAAALFLLQFAPYARAEDTPKPSATPDSAAADPAFTPEPDASAVPSEDGVRPSIPAPDADNPDLTASAANAAIMLREGMSGARYLYWETALGHAYNYYPLKKTTVNMLRCALGDLTDTPVGRTPVALRVCHEVPLPVDGQSLEKEWCYNLHGAIYSETALTSVTATLTPKDTGKEQTVTVTFDPANDVRAWSIDEDWQTVEQSSLNDGLNFALCAAGSWTLTISATTAGSPSAVQLYSSTFNIEKVKAHKLSQNLFDDNWDEAYAFFGGDTDSFLFTYYPKNSASSEFISTDQAWVKKYIVKSSLGSVHAAAAPYFEKANEYLENTYVLINTPKYDVAKPIQLKALLVEGVGSPRVPRFQKNWEFISHHALGTAVDINEHIYPNTNHEENHALIGDDVRDCLTYDGIGETETGQKYYEFTYTGTYKGYSKRVPNTILNYLLYELAFYRAGFSWGYYYETTCDAMHFMLSELSIVKHMDSDVGLRKVYEYYN